MIKRIINERSTLNVDSLDDCVNKPLSYEVCKYVASKRFESELKYVDELIHSPDKGMDVQVICGKKLPYCFEIDGDDFQEKISYKWGNENGSE